MCATCAMCQEGKGRTQNTDQVVSIEKGCFDGLRMTWFFARCGRARTHAQIFTSVCTLLSQSVNNVCVCMCIKTSCTRSEILSTTEAIPLLCPRDTCVRIYTSVCMCVCVCVCVCVCIFAHTHTQQFTHNEYSHKRIESTHKHRRIEARCIHIRFLF